MLSISELDLIWKTDLECAVASLSAHIDDGLMAFWIKSAEAVFKKYSDGSTNQAHIDAAVEKLKAIELEMGTLNESRPWRDCDWFQTAVHYVHSVLPPLAWVNDEMSDMCRFGPGVTYGAGGMIGRHLLTKVGGIQTITRPAIPIVGDLVKSHFPHWYESCLQDLPTKVVPGNRVAFVPKDVTKVRQIAIEPSLNMFFQLGIGSWISKRLKRFGMDLTDQEHNKELARMGSLTGSVSTLDLSDASSRIPRGLVEDLLPPDWFCLLDSVRSPVGLLPDGSHIKYESFSTQGNGYTFPLETLIFRAVISDLDVKAVYGDDIIVATSDFESACTRLQSTGAIVNPTKSFSTGSFRESCGGDYYKGCNVRPVYFRKPAKHIADVMDFHNQLVVHPFFRLFTRTIRYLRGLSRDPESITGFPYYWKTCEDNPLANKVCYNQSSHFWDLSATCPPRIEFVVEPVPVRMKSTNIARYLVFLYGGERSLDGRKDFRYRSKIVGERPLALAHIRA